ncbi:MAG: VacJ family lipoprotein [Rhodobacterales bacterium]|nr:VacJ family lipoprotein [Rhodobacterales bacterium]
MTAGTTADQLRFVVAVVGVCLLAGCAGGPGPDGINDPFEPANRKVHAFNTGLDRVLVGPVAKGYVGIVPEPAQQVVANVANTLDLPGDIVNNILQARIDDAATNTLRLGVNLTMGVAGIFDAATAIGLPSQPTDFGETLHVWGAGEGAYLEIPFSGPSTVRDATGTAVDLLANPVRFIVPEREAMAASVLKLLSRLRDRGRFSNTVESILYDSADSYAQSRLLFLQNRRFALGQSDPVDTTTDDDFIDPYEDPYAQ